MSEQTKDAAREAAWQSANNGTPMGVDKWAFIVGYDAGYAARDAETCVWAVGSPWHYDTGCKVAESCVGRPQFCPNCGRRVKEGNNG